MSENTPAPEPTFIDEADQLKLENASLKAQSAQLQLQLFQKEVERLQKEAQAASDGIRAKYEIGEADRVQMTQDGRLAIYRAPK